MMSSLQKRIENHIKTRFFDLRAEAKEHKTVIVSFLAILELVKQGNVLVTQIGRYGDIEIEMEQGSTPRYY